MKLYYLGRYSREGISLFEFSEREFGFYQVMRNPFFEKIIGPLDSHSTENYKKSFREMEIFRAEFQKKYAEQLTLEVNNGK